MAAKISACLVIYNEEKLIKRCLDSLKGVVDEIVIVHDGPCSDKTIDICKKYTKKIFIRERMGEAEPHRPFCLKQATGEWILALDADEYLTEKLRKNIRKLVQDKNIDGYSFIWTIYNKGKRITKGPLSKIYRLILFRKSKASVSGMVHEWYKVSGNIKNLDLVVEHRPLIEQNTLRLFMKKDIKWAFIHAKRLIREKRAERPAIFYAVKSVVWFILIFPYFMFIRLLILHGFLGTRIAFLQALYAFYINWYVFKLKL